MEPIPSAGLPHYRAIIALDIERSTSRPDSVKAELRNKTYELFDTALHSAGIHKRHRDRYIDRGDGLLALIHPVDQVPKALLLNRAIPALSSLLADYNASLPDSSRLQRQLRVRVVTHAGTALNFRDVCPLSGDSTGRSLSCMRLLRCASAAAGTLSCRRSVWVADGGPAGRGCRR